MGFKLIDCNIEGFFPSVLKVPGGMVIHTHSLTDSSNGIVSSEASVFVPCNEGEYQKFMDEHYDPYAMTLEEIRGRHEQT